MKNLKTKTNVIFLSLILSSYFLTPFIDLALNNNKILFDNQIALGIDSTQDLSIDNPLQNKINLKNWDEMVKYFDQNGNGIDDQFDLELVSLEKSLDTHDEINFIIQFPSEFNSSIAISTFKKNHGIIKHTYKDAINGFAGEIEYAGFFNFCQQLKQNKIKFIIEQDCIVEANLYYASRNMNLRPYVWNTLGYTGDNTSSIAILDTGIDDTHEFFDNYSLTGNFSYKIVAWEDKTPLLSGTPIDDNGHGSHVAGIAAGEGTPILDGLGRTVATESFFYDFYPYAYIDDYSLTFIISSFNGR